MGDCYKHSYAPLQTEYVRAHEAKVRQGAVHTQTRRGDGTKPDPRETAGCTLGGDTHL